MNSDQRNRLENLRVLIVEDNNHMAHILRTMLNGFGIRHIEDARNGADALELLRSVSYDFILLDYSMPMLDGIEFTRLLRTGSDHSRHMIPIIMVTGYTERSRVIEARDAGVTEICVKPVTARDLWARIAQVINSPRPFIRSKIYTGPDRRRRTDLQFAGEDRRLRKIANSADAT